MDLATLRAATEELTRELARRQHAARAGLAPSPELVSLFKDHREVVSPEALQLAREARATAQSKNEDKRARRLTLLSAHLFRLQALALAPAAHDAIARAEATGTVTGTEPGESLSLRTALRRLSRTGGREARGALEHRVATTLAGADGARSRAIEAFHEAALRAGFPNGAAAVQAFSGVDLPALAAEATQFLADTESMYEDVLSWWLRKTMELRPFPHGAEHHDLAYAFGQAAFEGAFPKGDPSLLLRRVGAMGLDPGRRVRIDVSDAARRVAFAVASPVDVPAEIQVVSRPSQGLPDTRAFLHAAGVALHLAGCDPARPFEDRWAFDPALPMATGFLLDHWLYDRRWLSRLLDVEAPDLVRVLALSELSRVRGLAASMRYELLVHTEGLRAGLAGRHAELHSQALLARVPETLHLVGFEDPFTSADALRALSLEAALFETLRDRFDEDWWQNPRAGPFLEKIFELGGFETTDAIAEKLGAGPLRLSRVARRLEILLS